MKRQLHEHVVDFFNKILPQYQQEVFERRRQTDNVVIWISGLSTGAIALILAQFNNLSIHPIFLKITVALFLFTVVSGVTFRGFIYLFEQLESELLMGFKGYCYAATSVKFSGPIKLAEHHTIEQIAKSLKEDMGLDYDSWLEKDYLDRNFWVNHYNKWADFWNKAENEGLRNLGKAFAPLLGKKPEETEELFLSKQDNKQTIRRTIRYRNICDRSYGLLLVFFVLAILSITVGFFFA